MEAFSKRQSPKGTPTKAFLSITEAAEILGISRNSAYLAAKRYRDTGGREGLPNIKVGGTYRVPASALERMADIAIPNQQAS